MTQDNRTRWRAGLEERARENARTDGMAYDLALAEEVVQRNQRIIAFLDCQKAYISAVLALPEYLVSAEQKIEMLKAVAGFLPDGLLEYIQEETIR